MICDRNKKEKPHLPPETILTPWTPATWERGTEKREYERGID